MAKPPHDTRDDHRSVHDLGGLPGGPVDTHEHTPTLTERRVDAMMMLLRDKNRRYFTTDENRRAIESMTPQKYEAASYYERWVRSLCTLMVEKGVLLEDEIAARLADVQARHAVKNQEAQKNKDAGALTGSAPVKTKGASNKPSAKGVAKTKSSDPFSAPGKTRAGARVKGEGGDA
jgi:nitrile hydratase subunit beta